MSELKPLGKILMIGSSLMSLYQHRLELIRCLLNNNYKVVILSPLDEEEKHLNDLGCKCIELTIDNRGTNIKKDYNLVKNIKGIYLREKPDIILTFYTKTNIYGGIVARWLKIPYIENICGLGTSLVRRGLVSFITAKLYRQALKKSSYVFFQNKSNIAFITNRKIYNGPFTLLPGSGVSLDRFPLLPYPESNKIEFLFCSRIIKEKGIEEYIEAAKTIKKTHPEVIFHIVGPCSEKYLDIINNLHDKGILKYHGKLMDLRPVLENICCCILPSYYPEGISNVLLESASSGRPVITTNLPGCKEVVIDGKTGFIVEERNSQDLIATIEKFISLPYEQRKAMGLAGRKKMEKEFNREIVVKEYLNKIKDILNNPSSR